MTTSKKGTGGSMRFGAALLVCAGVALALPQTSSAVVGDFDSTESAEGLDFMPFTPAGLDPALVREVASTVGIDALRFTPAARPARKDRTLTVAVRVDRDTARAISVRKAIEGAATPGLGESLGVAATRYDLGISRGYQGFAKPAAAASGSLSGVRDISMPDLSEFRPAESKADKPSRFQPRIALEQEGNAGRAPRTLEGLGGQSVDLGGSYRVTRNLDVTAGVRLSQDRDRLAPLTDGVDDNQAVYVGTQFRF